MSRKRKAVAQEDNTSNGGLDATSKKEKLYLHIDNSKAAWLMNVENSVQQNSKGIRLRKNSKASNVVVRRSERIRCSGLPSQSLKESPVIDHIDLVENEQEEEPYPRQVDATPVVREKNSEREPQVQEVSSPPEINEKSLEEKVEYLVRSVDEFKSKAMRQVFGRPNEGISADFSYKSLYFESQKKIEALIDQNYDLVRKLEFARGKIAAYESMKDAMSPQKEVIVVPALGKATEATASLSPRAVLKTSSAPPPPPPAAILDASNDPNRKKIYRKNKGKLGG